MMHGNWLAKPPNQCMKIMKFEHDVGLNVKNKFVRHLTLNPYAKGHTNSLTLICDLSLETKCMTVLVATYWLDAWFLYSKWSSNEACHTSSQNLWCALYV